MESTVRFAVARFPARSPARSVCASRLAVISSRSRTAGFAAAARAMESYCRKGDDESKVMYAYFDGAVHTIWNLIKENHLEVEYHAFTRARQRAEREENDKGMGAGRTGTGEGAKDVL